MSTDLLDMEFINSLPHPLFANIGGGEKWDWPVHDIEVQTGLFRIDVCGLLQVEHIGGALYFKDANGKKYDTDDFYIDAERAK